MTASHLTSSRTSLRDFSTVRRWSGYTSVASLHAHTHHSRENLKDVPRYLVRLPAIGAVIRRHIESCADRDGNAIDFSKGWWHPPVSPRAVFESEAVQIEQRFPLAPLVSITDHDNIDAGLELQDLYASRRAPVSFEWTVPFDRGFFHLGVHNLPTAAAAMWFGRLAAVTEGARLDEVGAALADLDALPEVLIVLNHPQWDLADVGGREHARALRRFLLTFRHRLHALELNGYRSWAENASVQPIAEAVGLPLVSGGDRHGTDPNALLNVTRARSFAEFVAEVRDGLSDVVVMPEYRQHLATRVLSSASDAVRRYRSHPIGRQRWTDRVSWDLGGEHRPLSSHWPDGGPLVIRSAIGAVQLMANPLVLRVLDRVLNATESRPSVPALYAGPTRQRATRRAYSMRM